MNGLRAKALWAMGKSCGERPLSQGVASNGKSCGERTLSQGAASDGEVLR